MRLVGRDRWHPAPAGTPAGPGGRLVLSPDEVDLAGGFDRLVSLLEAERPAVAEWAFL